MDINLKKKFIEQLHRLENMEESFLIISSWNKVKKESVLILKKFNIFNEVIRYIDNGIFNQYNQFRILMKEYFFKALSY